MTTNILLAIIAPCLVFIASSLVSIANTLWDILQELKPLHKKNDYEKDNIYSTYRLDDGGVCI